MLLIDRPWVIGHRGDASHAPENTLPAFEAALEGGAHGVECDVRLTRDGHVVVFHDDSTQRLLGMPGRIESMTRDLVRTATFVGHAAGVRVPDLDDVLVLAEERDAVVLVELKGEPLVSEDLARAVVASVERTRTADRVGFLSFSHTAVAMLHELAPTVPCAALFEHVPHPESIAFHGHAERHRWVVTAAEAAQAGWAQALRERGWTIGCYGVDDEETDARLDTLGIGLRISDRVERLLKARKAA